MCLKTSSIAPHALRSTHLLHTYSVCRTRVLASAHAWAKCCTATLALRCAAHGASDTGCPCFRITHVRRYPAAPLTLHAQLHEAAVQRQRLMVQVPSRIAAGSWYALPQSPQLFKQMLMAAGVDRYYQVARCFRDEDLRADRQPEFTQLDLEAAFLDQPALLALTEDLLAHLFDSVLGVQLQTPFQSMTYADAIERCCPRAVSAHGLRSCVHIRVCWKSLRLRKQ